MKNAITGPWLLMGDFNNVLYMDERIGSDVSDAEVKEFQRCVDSCELYDLVTTGAYYTWNNKDNGRKKTSFKYFNMWGKSEKYKDIVAEGWSKTITRCHMFQVVKKLKVLKYPLKQLNKDGYGDIENAAQVAKFFLEHIQSRMHNDPWDLSIQAEERIASQTYKELEVARVSYLALKAKVQWVNYEYYDSKNIEAAFLDYYESLLGSSSQAKSVCVEVVRRGKTVSHEEATTLIREVTRDEVKKALFSIPNEKAPGLGGYSSGFFRNAFDIVREDVKAVLDFFRNGKLLQQVNATLLTLIPKEEAPSTVFEFRPLADCNVLYKCISKVIFNRMARLLLDVISMNQAAFIQDREIGGSEYVKVLMRAFLIFSESSGLQMNKDNWAWRQLCKVREMVRYSFLANGWAAEPYSMQKVYSWLLGPKQKVDW
ncbi:uncharacterized protein LOC141632737 [Silene latifolia]|uniref:uncharacterized protein LOC141632737 n=1 Tax=Silene latifolia TaxID=37657 RepID=UPI003D788420